MRTTHTVDILVTDEQYRVLLVERGKEPFKGSLVLPGGHVELGEAWEDAAARELHEETGIAVAPASLRYLRDLNAEDRDPRGRYVSHVFTATVPSAVLETARAGSDAARVVIRTIGAIARAEVGFDHYDALISASAFMGYGHLRQFIRDVPDFPKQGITFRDITPLLGNSVAFAATVNHLARVCAEKKPTVIVALESRGFIFGAAVAHVLGCAFVPVRKPGKLPARTERVTYELEYGHGELEIHADAISAGARAVIVDDLLATGGTAAAATTLVERLGGTVVSYAFVIELTALGGRAKLRPGVPVTALLAYA